MVAASRARLAGSLGRRRRRLEERGDLVAIACQDLGDARDVVEADEAVGNDEAALGEVRAVLGQYDCRLELRDVVITQVAHHGPPCVELGACVLEGDEARA